MIHDKLNRKEDEVMNAVFTLANGKDRVLVTPYEIIALLPPKGDWDEEKLERILRALELDGYFELIPSDRKGEKMYVIHLQAAGLAYKRSDYQRKRSIYFKIALAVGSAVITFVIGLILKNLFS